MSDKKAVKLLKTNVCMNTVNIRNPNCNC